MIQLTYELITAPGFPASVFRAVHEVCHEISGEQLEELDDAESEIYLVTSLDDLISIPTVHSESLAERSSAYDCIEWVSDGTYLFVFLATSDAGGNGYFIPKWVVEKSPTIIDSINLNSTL